MKIKNVEQFRKGDMLQAYYNHHRTTIYRFSKRQGEINRAITQT